MTSHEKPYQSGQTSQESVFFPWGTTATILDLTHNLNHPAQQAQGFSKVAFSRACWPWSMDARGDREELLQFLRILPSRREGKMRKDCKREACDDFASA